MQKTITHPVVGEVIITRRRGTTHLKLSISGDTVRLSIPYGVSERAATSFLEQKADWIGRHRVDKTLLKSGDRIGRGHRLFFEPYETLKITTRIKDLTILVRFPRTNTPNDHKVQLAAERGSKKALQKEAEHILIQRLEVIAKQLNRSYTTCSVKFMKSRWGHCSHTGDVTLNSYLVQTPPELIDYVIVHELAHTVHHNHSSEFWELVARDCPRYKELRKQLKLKQTRVTANPFS